MDELVERGVHPHKVGPSPEIRLNPRAAQLDIEGQVFTGPDYVRLYQRDRQRRTGLFHSRGSSHPHIDVEPCHLLGLAWQRELRKQPIASGFREYVHDFVHVALLPFRVNMLKDFEVLRHQHQMNGPLMHDFEEPHRTGIGTIERKRQAHGLSGFHRPGLEANTVHTRNLRRGLDSASITFAEEVRICHAAVVIRGQKVSIRAQWILRRHRESSIEFVEISNLWPMLVVLNKGSQREFEAHRGPVLARSQNRAVRPPRTLTHHA